MSVIPKFMYKFNCSSKTKQTLLFSLIKMILKFIKKNIHTGMAQKITNNEDISSCVDYLKISVL
jgi:hypothetical protein